MKLNLPRPLFFKEGRRAEGMKLNLPRPLFSKEGRRASGEELMIAPANGQVASRPSFSRDARRSSPFEKGGYRGIRFSEMRA